MTCGDSRGNRTQWTASALHLEHSDCANQPLDRDPRNFFYTWASGCVCRGDKFSINKQKKKVHCKLMRLGWGRRPCFSTSVAALQSRARFFSDCRGLGTDSGDTRFKDG